MKKRIMSKILLIIFLFITNISFAETIYLKNGDVIKGTIKSSTKESIKVETSFELVEINRKNIKRIDFTESKNSITGSTNKKVILVVLDFENKTKIDEVSLGPGISDMMTTALVDSGKFRVVERKKLKEILEEQQFHLSGAVDSSTAVKIGKIIGAEAVITGSVTEFGITKFSGGVGCIIGFGGKKQIKSRVVIDAKIISVETTEVVAVSHSEGEETSEYSAASAGILTYDVGAEGFDSTTIGKATRKAVDSVVKKFVEKYFAKEE